MKSPSLPIPRASSVSPKGGLIIRTDLGVEAPIEAIDHFFPDPAAPDFKALKIEEAPPSLVALYRQTGRIPADVTDPIWMINVPFPNASDGHTFSVWVACPQIPSREVAMWKAWLAYAEEASP